MCDVIRKRVLLFLSIALFSNNVLATKADTPQHLEGTTRISAEELLELVEAKPNLVIIDARIQKDRSEGYIESAVMLTNVDMTEANLAEVVPDKSTPIVFYCNGAKCGRSVDSSKRAVEWGYTEIYWFRGGWEEWSGKGLPFALQKCSDGKKPV